ncbi:MAG: hypothetical protein PHQ75_09040 [Thermoguttaceae bacterium]|nr:hypothetical protein [Thermoguttaceae bacterium]
MQTFVDSTNRSWSLALNLGSAMKVRDRLGVDLLQPELGTPPLLDRLGTDEMLLGQIICILLENQFKTYNVTAEDVLSAFDGATILAASDAFYKELVDFFHRRGRTDRARAVEKQRTKIQAGIKIVETRLNRIDDKKRIAAMEKQADSILGSYYGDSEESSDSISESSLSAK